MNDVHILHCHKTQKKQVSNGKRRLFHIYYLKNI